MSGHLKRIGEIIGSFVSTDFKRKRLQDESCCEEESEKVSPAKKFKSSDKVDNEFLNVPGFMKRVASFTDFCWCRDIPRLSPLEVARHGWMSTKDDFMVKCVACEEHLSLAIPVPSSGIREGCIKTAVSRLFSAHGEFCAWASTSAPAYLSRVQVPDMQNIVENATKIAELNERLPYLRSDMMEPWKEILDQIDKDKFKHLEDDRIRDFSIVLALCGWVSGELEDTLIDIYGVRRLGAWNFISIQDEDDIEETKKVAEEMGSSLDKDSDYKPEGKDYLDPLGEHMTWHPLVQQEEGGKDKGWQVVRKQLCLRSPTEKRKESKKRDSFRVIYKVRDLLDQW